MSVSNFTQEIKKRNNGCQQNQGVQLFHQVGDVGTNGRSIKRPRGKDDVWEREDKC